MEMSSRMISKAAKRRQRKKKIQNLSLESKQCNLYDDIHSEAQKHFFSHNPNSLRLFGSFESEKLASAFADQCTSAMKSTDHEDVSRE